MTPFSYLNEMPAVMEKGSVLVPKGIETKDELLGFLAHALQLPNYFGHNWDALEECLNDPAWLLPQEATLLHQDIPLAKHPSEQKIYLEILAATARASSRLHVVFPEGDRARINYLLSLSP